MDLTRFANDIELHDGIWYAKQRSHVSYPEEGNAACFQIEENSFWFRHRNACLLAAAANFPPDGIFFDIGGGNGFVSKAFEQAGYETVLVEPGERGVLNARRRNVQNLVCSTLEDSQFKPGSLPAAGAFDVVEHIEDDAAFLKSLYTYLKPNGRLYLTVPAYKVLWSNEDDAAGHYQRYTLSGLGKKLRQCGFTVQYGTYMFSILPLPVLLTRTLPSRLGMRKGLSVEVNTKEHTGRNGLVGDLLERVWTWELQQIKKRKRIPIGGSVLVVARKK
jgi:SAM-dependent methyltransferase